MLSELWTITAVINYHCYPVTPSVHFNYESDKKTSLTNLFGITLHDILQFQYICSERQLKRFLMKLFLVVQSFLIKYCLFWLYDSLFFFYFSLIFAICNDQLQSDTNYSPTPGASMDAPDAPLYTPLDSYNYLVKLPACRRSLIKTFKQVHCSSQNPFELMHSRDKLGRISVAFLINRYAINN